MHGVALTVIVPTHGYQADPEAVLKAAFKLNLKRVEIDALGAEYRRQNMSTVQLAHATTPL